MSDDDDDAECPTTHSTPNVRMIHAPPRGGLRAPVALDGARGDGDDVAKRGVRARTRDDDDANDDDDDDASKCDDDGGDSGAHRGTAEDDDDDDDDDDDVSR